METRATSTTAVPGSLAHNSANPYLDAYTEYTAHAEGRNRGGEIILRSELVFQYAWAIPNAVALNAIAALSPLIELGAGAGYWAMCLNAAGADIIAYDQAPIGVGDNPYVKHDQWYNVQPGSVEQLDQHPERTLFLCWPPYNAPFAYNALATYKGEYFAFVGEHHGGCTGDDRFFETLSREWDEVHNIDIPRWYGINDRCYIYLRK
jgi:hypothetical protein